MFGTNSVNIYSLNIYHAFILRTIIHTLYHAHRYSYSLSCSLIVRSEFNLLNLVHVGKRVARCLAVLCALESRKYRPIKAP